MIKSLDFCFKGDREYVQGPDIVDTVLGCFEKRLLSNIDIRLNGIVNTGLDLVEGDFEREASVNIRLLEDDQPKFYQLVGNDKPVNCRNDFDERLILEQSSLNLELKSIGLMGVTSFSFCENIVSLNKALLQSLFPDETMSGKWYFTRLELFKVVPDDSLFTIKFKKNFNFRLTQSSIFYQDQHIANLYFTLVRG